MRCKDCIHFGICIKGFPWADGKGGGWCEDFKDKSRFIELPCEVGSKAFVLMFGRVITFIVERIELDSLEDTPTMRLHHGKHLVWEIELSEVGRTVFLTREEAEAELKKRMTEGRNEHHN